MLDRGLGVLGGVLDCGWNMFLLLGAGEKRGDRECRYKALHA
jgi:hypothetical protein